MRVKEVAIPCENLPQDFDGYRILQFCDLHVNAKTPDAFLRQLVETINATPCDIVVFVGDLLDAKAKEVEEKLRILKEIAQTVYFVSGNHDFISGLAGLQAYFDELGFIDMDDTSIRITRSEAHINLIGISDRFGRFFGKKRDIKPALESAREGFNILLSHQPNDLKSTKNYAIDLQLCGHTHGGQIFPFHFLVALTQPMVCGLKKFGSRWVYISKGIGSWGPEYRFLAPSEISLLTLRREG